MRRVTPIARKVNLIMVAVVAVGAALALALMSFKLDQDVLATARRNLLSRARVVGEAVRVAMSAGAAPIAAALVQDLRGSDPDDEIRLFRVDGVEAFGDNSTIALVNRKLARVAFADRATLAEPGGRAFDPAVTEARVTYGAATSDARGVFTSYDPLPSLPSCSACHGSDRAVRGVVRIRGVADREQGALVLGAAVMAAVAVAAAAVLSAYIHGAIVSPVNQVGDFCTLVGRGSLDARLSLKSRDEIGLLGDTVNEMVQGLYERFELSKFASTSTVQAIKNHEKGTRARMTLLCSNVRGFTAFCASREPEQTVEELNRVLGAQAEIIRKCGGDVDKYLGDQVVALFSGAGQAFQACHAAAEIQREIGKEDGSAYGGLAVGIGVATGDVVLGTIGSGRRADFGAIGDPVALAARLARVARAEQVVVAESTWMDAGTKGRATGPYRVRVKGAREMQRVYVLADEGGRA